MVGTHKKEVKADKSLTARREVKTCEGVYQKICQLNLGL
jgi:hypothetical protein